MRGDATRNVGSSSPVLVVTGPIGVGKTAVLHAADLLLFEAQIPHATVELEEIARYWHAPAQSRQGMISSNLASLWSNYAARGAERLLLAGVIEERDQLRDLREAIPGAQVTVIRLHAPLALIEERIRRREASPEDELDGARWLAPRMETSAVEDHVVENGTRPLREVASEVLRLAGWLP